MLLKVHLPVAVEVDAAVDRVILAVSESLSSLVKNRQA